MTYYEIHRMFREDYSISQISRDLGLNRRTIRRYLAMNEAQYEQYISVQSNRNKELIPFLEFVKYKLGKYPETSAAQMHDWLKEQHDYFPKVSPKTVYNFVMWVRQTFDLPKIHPEREYLIVDEQPYGKQAQVDFGEYNMRDGNGHRVKVWFFTMVLSRSRHKYVLFSEHHFTSETAIEAHERAFAFFQGIPDEIVYDQDRVFIVDENKGDIILTDVFKAYTKERSFSLHFCRKSDPESKGKIENVVKFTKQNFLYNRPFYNIETLNDEAIAWLGRTANLMPHNCTKKSPVDEWRIELPFLHPYVPIKIQPMQKTYSVRHDHSITWKGNFYKLPLGTYKGKNTQVYIKKEAGQIIISDLSGKEIYRHTIPEGRGHVVTNTDLRRDKSAAIEELIQNVSQLFDDVDGARKLLETIHVDKPRYVRDQLILIRQTVEKCDKKIADQALAYCIQNNVHGANDFKMVVKKYTQDMVPQIKMGINSLNPLTGSTSLTATMIPATSKIIDYDNLILNKN
jgi:hypothetical protein